VAEGLKYLEPSLLYASTSFFKGRNIIDLPEPDIIVIGGGISSLLAPFLDEIRERWRGACLNSRPLDIPLVLAHYGNDAGIAGAAALCE
jgi:predicted NBD/HSP70 family sugar kinase